MLKPGVFSPVPPSLHTCASFHLAIRSGLGKFLSPSRKFLCPSRKFLRMKVGEKTFISTSIETTSFFLNKNRCRLPENLTSLHECCKEPDSFPLPFIIFSVLFFFINPTPKTLHFVCLCEEDKLLMLGGMPRPSTPNRHAPVPPSASTSISPDTRSSVSCHSCHAWETFACWPSIKGPHPPLFCRRRLPEVEFIVVH